MAGKPHLLAAALLAALVLAWAGEGAAAAPPKGERARERRQMVAEQIAARGVRDPRVLAAMQKVPRHRFVRPAERKWAYEDHPLPIGHGQTISQPYIVALMTQALRLSPGEKVLEIGTGSGYQAAILAELGCRVYTIEIVPELGRRAARTLKELGYGRVRVRIGDGYQGWPEAAPFDAIILTAAPPRTPPALLEQLAPGGRMVLPQGPSGGVQELLLLRKDRQGRLSRRSLGLVRFVPMVHGHQ